MHQIPFHAPTSNHPVSLRQEAADACQRELQGLERRLLGNRPVTLPQLARVRDRLAALPCATGEYSRALNHLRNAIAYYRVLEFGAARYELMSLIRELKPLLEAA